MWRLPSVVRKRGCLVCVHCGCTNGNRAFTCKECKNQLPAAGKAVKRPKRLLSADVSVLRNNSQETLAGAKILSTKVRRDGPDYRTLVVCNEGKWKCFYKECNTAQDARERSASTSKLECTCQHITTVQEELQWHDVEQLSLDTDVLSNLPIPRSIRRELQVMKEEAPALVQRVSSDSFVVRNRECTQEHLLGLLHVRFRAQQLLPKSGCEPRPSFYCPCHTFQRFSSLLPGPATTPKLFRRCLHFYVCLWAFACNRSLRDEFSFYLSGINSEGEDWIMCRDNY